MLFYADGRLVGSAVLSAFVVALDLLNPGLRAIAVKVRRIAPNFLKVRILFCGLPVSIGKHSIRSVDPSFDKAIVNSIIEKMHCIAAQERISLLCAKEFTETECNRWDGFSDHGFLQASSLPQVRLRIRWHDFAGYLADLRSGFRRQVRQDLKAIGACDRDFAMTSSEPALLNGLRIVLRRPTAEFAHVFHELYAQVMARAEAKLEVLNQSFFEKLFESSHDKLDLIVFEIDSLPAGAVLLAEQQRTLYFLLAGIDDTLTRKHRGYFNLLYSIYALAMERGCEWIDMGQTSYWPKLRTGGVAHPMYFYLKSRHRSLNIVLRLVNHRLFPAAKLPQIRVFNSNTDTTVGD